MTIILHIGSQMINLYSAGIEFRGQNLTSKVDPAL